MGLSCTWYIGKDVLPWETAVLRPIARELLGRGWELSLYGWSPEEWRGLPFSYWGGLNGLEKGIRSFVHGKILHLWGKMPGWMLLPKFRSSLLRTSWRSYGESKKGIPLFFEGSPPDPRGFRLYPAFDKEWLWDSSSQAPKNVSSDAFPISVSVPPDRPFYPAVFDALEKCIASVRWISPGALPRPGGEELPLTMELFAYWKEYGGILLFTGPLSLSDIWLGIFASMLAVPVVAPKGPLCDDFFGVDGYISVDGALSSKESWLRALDKGSSKEGRNRAARCRLRAEKLFPLEDAVESFVAAYTQICRGKIFP